jgi:hypothetical protein
MEFQRDVMEFNHQIERNFGCKCLSLIPRSSPDDKELEEAAVGFMLASMECYVKTLKARSKQFRGKNRSTGGMSRESILEFLEVCMGEYVYMVYMYSFL